MNPQTVLEASAKKVAQGETIKVLDRALDILQILTFGPEGKTLPELSAELKLPPVTMRRFLQNMLKVGFVTLGPDHRYRPGLILLTLATTLRQNVNLAASAQPILDWLRDQTNETAGVRVRYESSAIIVGLSETSQGLRYVRAVGQGAPLHAGASGKLLLGAMSPEELDEYFATADLAPLTANTITRKVELLEEIERTRRLGYSISLGEVSRESVSLVVPVRDMSNRVVATIGIVAPMARMTVSKLLDLVPVVSQAGVQLSRQLGYDPDLQVMAEQAVAAL